jgi:hypothetical protein
VTRKEKQRLVDHVGGRFAIEHPGWEHMPTPKDTTYASSTFVRRFPSCIIRIGFGAGQKNDEFFTVVGWCESEDEIFASAAGKPVRDNDGHLARIQRLGSSREFNYPEFFKLVGVLIGPGIAKTYAMKEGNKSAVAEEMINDAEQFGFPYLEMMLRQRYGIGERLSSSPGSDW